MLCVFFLFPNSGLAAGVVIKAEGVFTRLKGALIGEDVQLGFARLDDELYLGGDEPDILAIMDVHTRMTIARGVAHGAIIEAGQVLFIVPGLESNDKKFRAMVRTCIDMANAIDGDGASDKERLARSAREDPDPAFRARSFVALADTWPNHNETRETALALLHGDNVPEMRLAGARHLVLRANARGSGSTLWVSQAKVRASNELAEDSSHAIEALIALCDDSLSIADTHRAEAVRVLGQHKGAVPELEARIRTWVIPGEVPSDELVSACLDVAQRKGIALPYDEVGKYTAGGIGVQIALAGALEFVDDDRVESALLGLLIDSDDAVAIAAANTLGRIGGTTAVHPLMQRSEGLLKSSDLKDAARSAIALIQGRVEGASQGGLSVAEHVEGGELSRVDEDPSD